MTTAVVTHVYNSLKKKPLKKEVAHPGLAAEIQYFLIFVKDQSIRVKHYYTSINDAL